MSRQRKKPEENRIPAPNTEPGEFTFHPIIRSSKIIPWGYVVSKEDPDILLPVERELILLERAKEFIKQWSYREVAEWLSEITGRTISHSGLWVRIKQEQKHNKDYAISRRFAASFKKQYLKARKLEEGYLGSNTLNERDIESELFQIVKEAEQKKSTRQGKARAYRRS